MFHLYFKFEVTHAPETYNRATFYSIPLLCVVAMREINFPQIHLLTKGLCFTPPDVGCYLCQFASLRVLSSCSVRTTSSNEPTNQSTNPTIRYLASLRAAAARRCRTWLQSPPGIEPTTNRPTNHYWHMESTNTPRPHRCTCVDC